MHEYIAWKSVFPVYISPGEIMPDEVLVLDDGSNWFDLGSQIFHSFKKE